MLKPRIIIEDSSLMVIDKPAGWIVNDALTTKNQPTLQSWLKEFKYPLAESYKFRSGIVHRLDKETSGLLVIAKNQSAFTELQKQFKDRQVQKTYLALVHGRVEPSRGRIEAPVGRLPWRRDRFGVLASGRPAQTNYKVLKYLNFKGKVLSLVELKPETGRTHQIRIHLKYLGHPLVADEFYAGRKTARDDRQWCPRLFLHAGQIEFNHPESGKVVSVSAELPPDLNNALKKLVKVN